MSAVLFRTLVLSAAFASAVLDFAWAQIPLPNVRATSVRFFESPYNLLPRQKREYAYRFGNGKPRFIAWELNLSHPAPGSRVDFAIEQLWLRGDGSRLARQTAQTYIEPNWTTSYHNASWGWREPGKWRAGSYRIDLYVKGQRIGSGSFQVDVPPNEAIAAYNQGLAFARAEKNNEAIAHYDRAIRRHANYAEAYNNRCAAYGELKKYDQALSDCSRALQIDPSYASAYGNRAAVYRRKGQYETALGDYNKALELSPSYGQAYLGRAFTYYFRKDYARAWQDIQRAQELGVKVDARDVEKLRNAAQSQRRPT